LLLWLFPCIFVKNKTMSTNSALQKAEALLPKLTERETDILLYQIFERRKTPKRGVSKTPGVCGGDACIDGTRMPIWSLVNHRLMGFSDLEILYGFPTVTADDLKTAWKYYVDNQVEIDDLIRDHYSAEEDNDN
jgi:uncharacterized protein (DUF433 family)